MLSELTVTDFAIIDRLHLRFNPGFNVLTGETGAGKSILVDAVSTILGGRADSDVIRSSAKEARVEGVFFLNDELREALRPILQEQGLDTEDETLILTREIRREGRSVCRVNGRAVTLRTLEAIGQKLVDIHGQSEHLSLLRVREHVDFLDRYGDLLPLRRQVAEKVQALRKVRKELAQLRQDERELARRIDQLQYQVQEIAAAKLQIGEEEELREERRRLAHAEELKALADEAYRALYEGGEEAASALDLVSQVVRALTGLQRLDPSLAPHTRAAEELALQMEELARALRAYRDSVEHDPARLQEVEDRLDLIYRLKRKYGDSIEEILAYEEAARRELETITHSEERIAALEQEEERLLREAGELAARLSAARQEAGERLAKAIEEELKELHMEKARFQVSITQTEDPKGVWVGEKRYAFDLTGIDKVEFLIAPNVGEPFKPLAKTASGGEASRLMLAMKAVLSAADRTPTLIFDEIDQGIGGRVGGVVGRKLRGLTGEGKGGHIRHQVLCVTHLPQLACYGHTHFKVEKREIGGRTVTRVRELSFDERVEELAAMLGSPTELARQSARQMLREAAGKSPDQPSSST